jgi:hypothetical protein
MRVLTMMTNRALMNTFSIRTNSDVLLALGTQAPVYLKTQALAGSTFSTLFRFVEEQAHRHEYGLGAIFVVLQNDGDDHFCKANNRRIE